MKAFGRSETTLNNMQEFTKVFYIKYDSWKIYVFLNWFIISHSKGGVMTELKDQSLDLTIKEVRDRLVE